MMPTGRLRAGFVRVAGVGTAEAAEEIEKLMEERGLPSRSRALGVALEEWLIIVRRRVINPGPGDGPSNTNGGPREVVNPRETKEGGA